MTTGRRLIAVFGSMVLLSGIGVLVLWQYGVPALGLEGVSEGVVRRTVLATQAFADKEQGRFEQWFVERRRELARLAEYEDLARAAPKARLQAKARAVMERELSAVAGATPGAYDSLLVASARDLSLLAQADTGGGMIPASQIAALREVLQPGLHELVTLGEGGATRPGPKLLVAHQIETRDAEGQETGEVIALLLASLELTAPIQGQEIAVQQALGADGALMLLDHQGRLLAAHGKGFETGELVQLGALVVAGSEATRRVHLPRHGELVMVHRHLHLGADNGLSLVALRTTEDAIAATRGSMLGVGAVVGLATLLALMLLVAAARRVDRAEAAERRLNADLEQRVAARTAELIEALKAAELANQAKSTFLSTVSHELRTPLNGIIGMTEMLMGMPLAAEQHRLMGIVRRSGRDLLALINDLLDFSKSEAGQLQLEAIDFDARALAQEVIDSLAGAAAEKGLALRSELPPAPAWLHGDPHRLRQVLANLVANAVKFTASGEVVLRLQLEPAADGTAARQHFEVADTGIGIAPERLPQLFQAFSQLETSMARRFGGTGLGLAISQQLVALMGSRIEVASIVGQGSRFHFTLQLPAAQGHDIVPPPNTEPESVPAFGPTEPPERVRSELPADVRVLVVEDNPVNQEVARIMLASLGVAADFADDGQQALSRLAAGHPYDLVLMDCQMPGMDGFEATRQIRAAEAAGTPRVPIIALTANALAGDRERCLEAGMDDHLTKPFALQQLHELLAVWLAHRRQPG